MRATLILADAASGHPDGTFSLLRGGITQANVAKFPAPFRGALVIRVTAEPSEVGRHTFRILLLNYDGATLLRMEGGFEVKADAIYVNVCLNVGVMLPAEGRYSFRVTVDNREEAEWPLMAVPTPTTPPQPAK